MVSIIKKIGVVSGASFIALVAYYYIGGVPDEEKSSGNFLERSAKDSAKFIASSIKRGESKSKEDNFSVSQFLTICSCVVVLWFVVYYISNKDKVPCKSRKELKTFDSESDLELEFIDITDKKPKRNSVPSIELKSGGVTWSDNVIDSNRESSLKPVNESSCGINNEVDDSQLIVSEKEKNKKSTLVRESILIPIDKNSRGINNEDDLQVIVSENVVTGDPINEESSMLKSRESSLSLIDKNSSGINNEDDLQVIVSENVVVGDPINEETAKGFDDNLGKSGVIENKLDFLSVFEEQVKELWIILKSYEEKIYDLKIVALENYVRNSKGQSVKNVLGLLGEFLSQIRSILLELEVVSREDVRSKFPNSVNEYYVMTKNRVSVIERAINEVFKPIFSNLEKGCGGKFVKEVFLNEFYKEKPFKESDFLSLLSSKEVEFITHVNSAVNLGGNFLTYQ